MSLVCVRLEFRHYAFIVPKIAVDIDKLFCSFSAITGCEFLSLRCRKPLTLLQKIGVLSAFVMRYVSNFSVRLF